MMTYFSNTDHIALSGPQAYERGSHISPETPHHKMINLHRALNDRIRANDWDLHPHANKNSIVTYSSATTHASHADVLSISYFRSVNHTQLVENLMGIDTANCDTSGEPYRHPVIEVRLAPDYFAVELVLSPFAWWDQQNFIGKLELDSHRHTLRRLISNMSNDYRFGFWEGTHLSDMHLTAWELSHGKVMQEWMNTFADGQDWLRFGVWYEPESPELSTNNIVQEVTYRIGDLYNLYDFMLWTSNNNFMAFYEKRQKTQRRAFA